MQFCPARPWASRAARSLCCQDEIGLPPAKAIAAGRRRSWGFYLAESRAVLTARPSAACAIPAAQELLRVLRDALHHHLEVQVRPGRTACRADVGDLLAALDQVALLHPEPGGVGIAGDQVVAVVDFDHVAVGGMNFLRHHDAAGGGQDGRARVGLEVQPGVQRASAGERIDAPAER